MATDDYIMPLTSEQLERAARFLCEISEMNPDELIPYDNGEGHAVLIKQPRWRVVAEDIAMHDLMQLSINLVRGITNEAR